MAGFSFVADTNFLIAVHEGKSNVVPFLEGTAMVSVISEIELLGWYKLSPNEKRKLEDLLNDCVIIELTSEIKKLTISLRQQYKIKTPDAIIAATSQFLSLPIVTADKGFKGIERIELILI